jgi:hypothetical protein
MDFNSVNRDHGTYVMTVKAGVALTITPTTSNIVKPAGIYEGSITITGDTNLVSGNIKSGISIFGVSGKTSVVDTVSGTATASQILNGQIAFVNGASVTGSMTNRSGTAQANTSHSVSVHGPNPFIPGSWQNPAA